MSTGQITRFLIQLMTQTQVYSGIRFGSTPALWLGDVSGSLSNELISFNGNGAAHEPMDSWKDSSGTISDSEPQLIAHRDTGSKMEIYLNGELKNNAVRSSSAGDLEIDEFQFGLPSGSTNFLNGYVGEFIVFDESIGDEFENVHAYLAKKWGIQATVDSDNDGVADASDTYPVDATKSFDAPDFSEVVGAINADNADATGLAAVEGNLALWLDAANLNGVSNTGVNDGDAISSWMDLSGNENHAIESDTSKMPTIDNDVFNNMKSIKFDGSDDQLKLTQRALLGKNYTLFIVAQSLAANQESGSLLTQYNSAYNSGIGRGGFYSYQDKVGFWMGGYSGKYTSPIYGVADPFIMTATNDDNTVDVFVNGDVRSSEGGISVTTPIDQDTYIGQQLGVNEPLNGSISEIIVFDSVLTDSQIMSIQAYLANKWNLTSIVDSDGDGWTDAAEIAADSDPADDTSLAISYPDFSDAVDAEIGTSDLDSIEGNLVLWLDAENINGENNAGLTDNQAIDRWFDMSEWE